MVQVYHPPNHNKEETGMPSRWVTRERPKIDRIACRWSVRRFVAKDAALIYVPIEKVFAVAQGTGPTSYDISGAGQFSHHNEQRRFEAFLDHYQLHELALARSAVTVRGAETARLDLARINAVGMLT
jgi:hypothetical protein